jgi:DNA-binding HxlR family transcriptional regulator
MFGPCQEVLSMDGYGQYCPLAKGAEVFAERWTPLIMRELLRGSTAFNDLHRGVPRMSRSLLSSRLRKLEACGVVERRAAGRADVRYQLTQAGRDLGTVVTELGSWAQRWYRSTLDRNELDAGVLMWDIRCTIDTRVLPTERTVVQFVFPELQARRRFWWLVIEAGDVDLCPIDPGDPPALVIHTPLRTMTRIWMGEYSVEAAQRSKELELRGSPVLRRSLVQWLRLSPYAPIQDARREQILGTPASCQAPRAL